MLKTKPNFPRSKKIIALAEKMPYFSIDNFSGIENNKNYLKILFSRNGKTAKFIRLKKGLYTTREYVENLKKKNSFGFYPEFIANTLYSHSYLSLDYVLYEHGLLSEIPKNFTSICKNKTTHFTNKLGNFFYHKIKDELFCGFKEIIRGDFTIYKASSAKALFDWLYLRQNLLTDKKSIEELRINKDNFNKNDIAEFKKYLQIAKSKKMENIFSNFLD